jgi:hypothetical protein
LKNLYFLAFLNGFLIASLFYFKMEKDFETEIFASIHSDIKSQINKTITEDALVVQAMHTCHSLMINRGHIFGDKSFDGIKADLLNPVSIDLMTASGACGSYSMVLARVLQEYHFRVRIAQMKSEGVFAAHNIVEAETGHGWTVLDPTYDLYFTKPNGDLASFAEVKNNWNYYKSQVPVGYNFKYRYEDVRYSNWSKIPVILPAIKKILDMTLGKTSADTISMRTYFLRKYEIGMYCVAFCLLIVLFNSVLRVIRLKVFPRQNIPVTFSNIYKYLRHMILVKPTRHTNA